MDSTKSNENENTLAIKEIKSISVDGTKELEVKVYNFGDTNSFLKTLGYKPRTFQGNFRIEYILNNVNLDLDKWSMIPAFLEIEKNRKSCIGNDRKFVVFIR